MQDKHHTLAQGWHVQPGAGPARRKGQRQHDTRVHEGRAQDNILGQAHASNFVARALRLCVDIRVCVAGQTTTTIYGVWDLTAPAHVNQIEDNAHAQAQGKHAQADARHARSNGLYKHNTHAHGPHNAHTVQHARKWPAQVCANTRL